MGYNTDFGGELKFTSPLSAKHVKMIENLSGVSHRKPGRHWSYFDLVVTDDGSGIQWSGAEKTYELDDQVNFLIDHMRANGCPEFGLTGEMNAHGDERDDDWILRMVDGRATVVKLTVDRYEEKPDEISVPRKLIEQILAYDLQDDFLSISQRNQLSDLLK